MEPIRVLQIVPNMQAGGLETFIMNVYRNINRSEVQFDFLVHYEKTCFYDREILDLGGRIFRLSVREDHHFIQYFKELNAFFKNHPEYQIVHGHMPSLGFFYFFFAKTQGIKTRICHSHNTSTDGTKKGLAIKIASKQAKYFANHLFACSLDAGKFLYGKRNFTIIPNAIEIQKYVYNDDIRIHVRKRLHLNNKLVIGHIGRFELQKNHVFLLKIFLEIHKKNPDTILMLIGTGMLLREMKEIAWQTGLQNSVLFMGVRKDVNELYQAMDIFVLPSLFEGLPVVAIEAQCAGLPVIVSDAVTTEACISNNFHTVSLTTDADHWADKILNTAVDHSRENMASIISNSGFDIKSTAKDLTDFYKNHHEKIGERQCQFT